MWQRFTERARQVVFYAQEEAAALGEDYVSPYHLLLGITRVPESIGAVILKELGVSLDNVRASVEAQVQNGEGGSKRDMQLTSRARRVIDLAYDEARGLEHSYIGVEHILLGLLREGGDLAAKVLADLGVTLDAVREQLQQMQDKGSAPEKELPLTGKMHELTAYMKAAFATGTGKSSEELLSLDEAVKFLGTSKPTLYRLLGQDEIKGLKVGRQWRFRKADLIAYMERGPVAVTAAPKEDLDMELAFFAQQLSQEEPDTSGDPETKTIRLAHQIMQVAIGAKASDIHLEPNATDFLLRLRVDGVLQETRRLPASTRDSLTARFKMMAEIDTNEKRLPQDGRIPVRHDDKDFDFRVAVVPSMYGEAITMRILAKQDVMLGLDKLGIFPEDLRQLRDLLRLPNGIVVATGPTGSGKSTLLYSCLQEIVGVEKKTLTVEDPVELVLPYATQTQVNKKAGLTFATALRSFLRQDPDVIMVGEMRDLETAQITVEAALTGHLALTALHTNDAPSALLRLMDMGLEPYLIGATVTGIIATRLVRRVCENCKRPVDLSASPTLSYVAQLAAEGGYAIPDDAQFVAGAGCEQCRGRGYRGRAGLYEVLTMTEALTEAVLRRAPVEELTELAVSSGMRTLLADGIRKAVEGQTTVEEVMRVGSYN
jgi:excisionase family DNA binding protein